MLVLAPDIISGLGATPTAATGAVIALSRILNLHTALTIMACCKSTINDARSVLLDRTLSALCDLGIVDLDFGVGPR